MILMQPRAVCARFKTFENQFRGALLLRSLGIFLTLATTGCFRGAESFWLNSENASEQPAVEPTLSDLNASVPDVPQLLIAKVIDEEARAADQSLLVPTSNAPLTPLNPEQALAPDGEFPDDSLLAALLESQIDSAGEAADEGAELFGISGRGEQSNREIGLDSESEFTSAEEDAEIDAAAETAVTASLAGVESATLGLSAQTSQAEPAKQRQIESASPPTAAPEPRGPVAPIRLQVAQAFFQEQTLRVKVRLTALTDIPAAEVVIAVVGLREGLEVEEHTQVLLDVVGTPQLVEDQSVLVPFTLTSTGLTEYQVRGSWGAEARKSLPGLVRTEATERTMLERSRLGQGETSLLNGGPDSDSRIEIGRELRLDNVSIQSEELPCDDSPCDQKYSINASVVNASSQTIDGVSLAIGIYWVNQGSLPKLPEPLAPASASEEVVSLGGMVLDPGVSRKVRIAVDREIPAVPGGQFVPHVRILEYQTRPRQ